MASCINWSEGYSAVVAARWDPLAVMRIRRNSFILLGLLLCTEPSADPDKVLKVMKFI